MKHLNIKENDFKINVNAYLVMALRPFYAFVLSKTVLLFKQSTKPLMKRIDLLNMYEKEAVLPEINRSNRNIHSTLRKISFVCTWSTTVCVGYSPWLYY